MRIAQVSPLFEAVPPRMYGGTERIVYNLTEALIQEGHDVTLYASGDSLSSAPLRANLDQAIRLAGLKDAATPHAVMFERLRRELDDFDVVHFHTEYLHFGACRAMNVPHVSTMHGRLDLPEFAPLFREFADLPLVSISENQKKPLPHQNWAGCVHHGLLGNELKFHPQKNQGGEPSYLPGPDRYLAFLGRLSREKRVDRAIEISRRMGWKLKIAAKVEPEHCAEYLEEIEDLLREPHVEFVGEINENQKDEFLGNAAALLFPIDWPEPFGLVMIEALAVGTPVIAFSNGSVPEVIRDGQTGFVVSNNDEACEAVARLGEISRELCRHEFETRFSAKRMARDYVRVYERLIQSSTEARADSQSDSRPRELSEPRSIFTSGLSSPSAHPASRTMAAQKMTGFEAVGSN